MKTRSGSMRVSLPVFLLVSGFLSGLLTACEGPGSSDEGAGPDPGNLDYPIAYSKRPFPLDNNGDPLQADQRDPLLFSAGGDIYVRDRSAANALETNITSSVTLGRGDAKDIDVSFNGKKILFSLRLEDPNPNDNVVPSWNIYEYDRDSQQLHRIITDQTTAEKGDDIDPHYLPDGRIVFSSSRQNQSKAILLQETSGKPQFSTVDEDRRGKALVLHVMNPDGSNIQQISFNQSHDLDPVVMSSGEILFSRWDGMGNQNEVNLHKIAPDGTGLELVYGSHSHATGTGGNNIHFLQPREMPDGKIMVLAKPFNSTFAGGDIVLIDVGNYIDNSIPVAANQGASGPAQRPATVNVITTDGSLSRAGRYHDAYPLQDGSNRFLVSKGLCQISVGGVSRACIEPWVNNPNAQELPTSYGIWIYDPSGQTEKPVVIAESGKMITDVVAMQSIATTPPVYTGATPDTDWEVEKVGMLYIRSVYDFDGSFNDLGSGEADIAALAHSQITPAQRPARFLRIVKAVGIPDRDDPTLPDLANTAFGVNRRLGMREIIGYAQVEPDGSVMVKVPEDIAFTFDVVDAQGRRLHSRHENWFQLRAGEKIECNGCHSHPNNTSPLPHGRSNAVAAAVNQGAGVSAPYTLPLPLPAGLETEAAMYAVQGDTMAKVRYDRCAVDLLCIAMPTASDFNPRVDMVYEDFWTDASKRAKYTSTGILYADLDHLNPVTDAPASSTCQTSWVKNCRSIINYQKHIQPIWSKSRGAGGADTCTSCHDAAIAPMDPTFFDHQLDLTNTASDEEADHIESYRELLFRDNGQVLDAMGNLVDATITRVVLDANGDPVLDANGNPVTETVIDDSQERTPSMSANGAINSSVFFDRFSTAGDRHENMLTAAELRLLYEWLDMGAQYFNNPFDPAAPAN